MKTRFHTNFSLIKGSLLSPLLIGVLSTLVVTVSAPQKISKSEIRTSQRGMVIRMNQVSPAIAALEDVRFQDTKRKLKEKSENQNLLTAGKAFDYESVITKDKAEPVNPWIRLTGMKVSSADGNKQAPKIHTENIRTVAAVAPATELKLAAAVNKSDTKVPTKEPSIYDANGDLLPLEVRTHLLASYYQEYDFSSPSVSDRAKALVRREFLNLPEATRRPVHELKRSTQASLPSKTKGQPVRSLPDRSHLQTVALSGKLQFINGLAYLGADTDLSVYWVVGGEVLEKAYVRMSRGEYEIVIDRLEGYLVAEYRGVDGQLYGEAEVSLYDLVVGRNVSDKISDIDLFIEAKEEGLIVEVRSGRSFADHVIPESDTKVFVGDLGRRIGKNRQEQYQDKEFLPSSSYVLETELKNHWGSLAVGISQSKKSIEVFPNSLVQALLGISGSSSEEGAVIWGKVVVNGKVVKGAEVELLNEANRPIYFNTYLPDQSLKRTSKNGLFAFVGVNPGIQAVRVNFRGKNLLGEIVPAKLNKVSYLELDIGRSRIASIKVADPFTGRSLPASLNFIGSDEQIIYQPGVNEQVRFPGGEGLMWIDTDAGPSFELVRQNISRKARHIELTGLRTKWLRQLAGDRRVNPQPGTGVLVGFVKKGLYKVIFGGDQGFLRENVAYFDASGNLVTDGRPSAGGGFVIYNVPTGYRTLTLLPEGSTRVKTKAFVSDPEVVNVINLDL